MNFSNKTIRFILTGIVIKLSIYTCLAVKPVIPKPITPGPEKVPANTSEYFSQYFIPFFTKSFVQISGIIAVLFMIYAGVQFLTAYGNEEKIGTAKKATIYAALGFLVTLISYAIISILNSINLFQEPG